jgi:predicted HD phosphohydrolase
MQGAFENTSFIIVKLCGFYNKGYDGNDIAITSYKHTFHPFCCGELIKKTNKCMICGQILHLHGASKRWITTTKTNYFDYRIQSRRTHLDMHKKYHPINLNKSIWTYLP